MDGRLAAVALARADVRRLITIPGVDAVVALGIVAAIGDIHRFPSLQKLIGYLGLDPRVRQSGLCPARYGRISKQGRAHARGMLVEAAWAAADSTGAEGMSPEEVEAEALKLPIQNWRGVPLGTDATFPLRGDLPPNRA